MSTVNYVYFYRPCSEASEGYVFTGICHSVILGVGGGVLHQSGQHLPPTWDQVTTPPSPLPGTRSHTYLGPGHNTSLPPPTWDQVTTPPSPDMGPVHNIPHPLRLCTGGWYASCWNVFLYLRSYHKIQLKLVKRPRI